MKKIFLPLIVFMALAQTSSWAACGTAGTQRLNENSHQMEFCDGNNWHLIGAPMLLPTTGCSGDDQQQTYNLANQRMEYCYQPDTTRFNTNCYVTVSACNANDRGKQQYVPAKTMMQYCNGSFWVNMGSTTDHPCCPDGFIPVAPDDLTGITTANYPYGFCVSKYHMKAIKKADGIPQDNGGNIELYFPESRAAVRPWVGLKFNDAQAECASLGSDFHIITNAEWMTIAKRIENNTTNWSGNAIGTGYIPRGHSDNNPNNTLEANTDDTLGCAGTNNGNCMNKNNNDYHQKRTLILLGTNDTIWDFAGNINSWVASNLAGGSVGYIRNNLCPTNPCLVPLDSAYVLNEPGATPIGRYFAITSPSMYPPNPSQLTNKFAFLPANDILWNTGINYVQSYDAMGFGMTGWSTGVWGAPAIVPYRGGYYNKPGGIYSVWLDLNRNTAEVTNSFRCVYVPPY